ncbi:MAG TPA: nuclear transport factor 2 family protein [Acidimicrobiales bacterium]|nr:nuclear transport factor 2 family protein [Acidimicrobiales bacterium]
MEGIELDPSHPARRAAIASIGAVEAGDRDSWLALFTTDAVVADPVGPSPFDPDGHGHRGIDAIGAFYDAVIADPQIRFSIRESYVAGSSCANVGTITSTFADGSAAIVDGIYVYEVTDDGLIASLRAYWELDNLRMTSGSPEAQ